MGGKVWQRIFLVPRNGIEITSQSRFNVPEIREAQGLVDASHLDDRVRLQCLEVDLAEMALRNQPSFLEKSIVNLLVLSEDAIMQITEVRSLERPHRSNAISDQMLGRLEDIKRIPTNVDELRFASAVISVKRTDQPQSKATAKTSIPPSQTMKNRIRRPAVVRRRLPSSPLR